MKKYNEEYFSVIDKNTGKKIVDCGEYLDAMVMVSFDTQNRTITTNKMLMGPVVDIEMPKALPTSSIVGGVGGSYEPEYSKGANGPGPLPQIKLPEGQGIPVNAK